jgi:hypothetical protein
LDDFTQPSASFRIGEKVSAFFYFETLCGKKDLCLPIKSQAGLPIKALFFHASFIFSFPGIDQVQDNRERASGIQPALQVFEITARVRRTVENNRNVSV